MAEKKRYSEALNKLLAFPISRVEYPPHEERPKEPIDTYAAYKKIRGGGKKAEVPLFGSKRNKFTKRRIILTIALVILSFFGYLYFLVPPLTVSILDVEKITDKEFVYIDANGTNHSVIQNATLFRIQVNNTDIFRRHIQEATIELRYLDKSGKVCDISTIFAEPPQTGQITEGEWYYLGNCNWSNYSVGTVSVGSSLLSLPSLNFTLPSINLTSTLMLNQKPTIDEEQLAVRIHQLINDERKSRGLRELSWSEAIARAAKIHSDDMATRNYFEHNDPEGHDFTYRYSQVGFKCQIQQGGYIYLGAENIFQNNLYDSVTYVNFVPVSYNWNTLEQLAVSTVDGWMNSPGHRDNILTPQWRSEGIAVAIAKDDKVHITQDFC